MAQNRIGPRIEHLPERDRRRRIRTTYFGGIPRGIVTASLQELQDYLEENDTDRPGDPNYDLVELASEIEDVVVGNWRPVDRIFADQFFYTDFDYWKENHLKWAPPYPHRIRVDAYITSSGNLSVQFSPECLGKNGDWEHAPEWKHMSDLGRSAFRQRPNDEVLFIRNVERFLIENFEDTLPPLRHAANDDEDRISVACQAINMAFWLVVFRLSTRFEVHLGHYVTMLTNESDGSCLGLDIVDAVAEHRASIESQVDAFERLTGHPPEHFWEICQKGLTRSESDWASQKLRGRDGPSSGLTPAVVRRWHGLLRTAADYGLWSPDGQEPSHDGAPTRSLNTEIFPSADVEDEDDPENRLSLVRWRWELIERASQRQRAEERDPGRRNLRAQEEADRRDREAIRRAASRPPEGPRDPFTPPSYDGLWQAALPDEIKAEFGLETARAMVDRLNDLWRSEGQPPITQGSFPTNRQKLKFIVRELRRALARTNQEALPDLGSSSAGPSA